METSIVINQAPFVKMTLLNRILAARILAVGDATSSGYLILLPPSVNLCNLAWPLLAVAFVNESNGTGAFDVASNSLATQPNVLVDDRLEAFSVFRVVKV